MKVSLTLSERPSGKRIWERTFEDRILLFSWASDHRVLCIGEYNVSPRGSLGYRLYLWREGRPLSAHWIRPLYDAPGGVDVLHSLTWSPDHRRLLILRSYNQGGASMGYYDLFCYRLRDGETHYLGWAVTHASWETDRRVVYRQVGYKYVKRNGMEEMIFLPETTRRYRCP